MTEDNVLNPGKAKEIIPTLPPLNNNPQPNNRTKHLQKIWPSLHFCNPRSIGPPVRTQSKLHVWFPCWLEAPLSRDSKEMLPEGCPLCPLPKSCNVQVGISCCLGSDQSSRGHRGEASEASPTNPLFLQVEPKVRLPGWIRNGQLSALLRKEVPNKVALTKPMEQGEDTRKETAPTQATSLLTSSYHFLPFEHILH